MARKSSESLTKEHNNREEKARGSTSDSQALRTKFMDETIEIEAMDFGLGIGKILTPKSLFQYLQQQSEIRHKSNEWLQSIHDNTNKISQMNNSGNHPIFQQFIDCEDLEDDHDCENLENVEKQHDKPVEN